MAEAAVPCMGVLVWLRLNSSPSSFKILGQGDAAACMQVLVPHGRAITAGQQGLSML